MGLISFLFLMLNLIFMYLSQLFTLAEKDLCTHTDEQLIHMSRPSDSQKVSGLQPGFMVKFESTKGLDYPWPADIIVIYFVHTVNIKKTLHEC